MANGVNPGHGPHRRPMGDSRAAFPSEAAERWAGRPWQDTRAVLNGVCWVLRTGAPWHDLPRRYPPYQTCHRRFQQWQRSGLLEQLLKNWPKTYAIEAS